MGYVRPELARYHKRMSWRRDYVPRPTNKRCGLCGLRGHNRRTCNEPRLRDDPKE